MHYFLIMGIPSTVLGGKFDETKVEKYISQKLDKYLDKKFDYYQIGGLNQEDGVVVVFRLQSQRCVNI